MEQTTLKGLLELYQAAGKGKKHELNKEEQHNYAEEVFNFLKVSTLTPEAVHYIAALPFFGGLSGFSQWAFSLGEDETATAITTLLSADEIKAFNSSRKCKLILTLLAMAFSDAAHNDAVIRNLLYQLVGASYTKDRKKINELSILFKNGFLANLSPVAQLPDLKRYQFPERYFSELLSLFEEAICGITAKTNAEIQKINTVKIWLQNNGVDQQVISDHAEEQDLPTDCPKDDETAEQQEAINTSSEEVKTKGRLSQKLIAFASAVESLETELQSLKNELREKDREIKGLRATLSTVCAEKAELEAANADLKNILADKENNIIAIEAEKKNLEDRVLRQASVLNVYTEDKANSQTEQLNAIASALVKYYKDFETAQSMTLTTEIEMTLLDLIEDIFKKLEKLGIDIKGRS